MDEFDLTPDEIRALGALATEAVAEFNAILEYAPNEEQMRGSPAGKAEGEPVS